MKRVEKLWEVFEQAVVPKEAGQVQRQEMKIAFFGGALSMFDLLMEATDESVSEDCGVDILSEVGEELLAFSKNPHGKGENNDPA